MKAGVCIRGIPSTAVAHDGQATSLNVLVGIGGHLHDDIQLHNPWRFDEDDE